MLIWKIPRNFWHVSYERHAREAHILADSNGCAMRKSLVCAASARLISFSRLSSFKPASKETLGPGTDGVHRAAAGRFAVTRVTQSPPDWPCANLTYHSRTPTTLLFSRRTLNGERTRDRRATRWRSEHVRNTYVEVTRVSVTIYVSITDPSVASLR